jgi:hypothetical protein
VHITSSGFGQISELALRFCYKSVFKPFHVLPQLDPNFEVCRILISEPLNSTNFCRGSKFGMAKVLDVAVLRCCKVNVGSGRGSGRCAKVRKCRREEFLR